MRSGRYDSSAPVRADLLPFPTSRLRLVCLLLFGRNKALRLGKWTPGNNALEALHLLLSSRPVLSSLLEIDTDISVLQENMSLLRI